MEKPFVRQCCDCKKVLDDKGLNLKTNAEVHQAVVQGICDVTHTFCQDCLRAQIARIEELDKDHNLRKLP